MTQSWPVIRDLKLESNGSNGAQPLSLLAIHLGLTSLTQVLSHIEALPYGRNSDRSDLSLVLKKAKGTCSSKHALVAAIALEQKWDNVKLVLCMYKMNGDNTIGIGDVLNNAGLSYIPEAHCYLKIDNQAIDITNPASNYARIAHSVLQEVMIEPAQVGEWKVEYHQTFLKEWIKKMKIQAVFDEIWSVREACIRQLEMMSTFP